MGPVLTAADAIEHNIWIIAIGGHFGAEARSAGHYTTVVASYRTGCALRDGCPFNEFQTKLHIDIEQICARYTDTSGDQGDIRKFFV